MLLLFCSSRATASISTFNLFILETIFVYSLFGTDKCCYLQFKDILENQVLIILFLSIYPVSSCRLLESSKHSSVQNLQRWKRTWSGLRMLHTMSKFLWIRNCKNVWLQNSLLGLDRKICELWAGIKERIIPDAATAALNRLSLLIY